jgi:hypothetical protein
MGCDPVTVLSHLSRLIAQGWLFRITGESIGGALRSWGMVADEELVGIATSKQFLPRNFDYVI